LATPLELRPEGITVDEGTVLAAGGVGYCRRCRARAELDDVAVILILDGCDERTWAYPHPGCFGKRGWNCLKTRALTFLERAKRLQVAGGAGDRQETEGKKSDRSAA
jgi:hypothetical protein